MKWTESIVTASAFVEIEDVGFRRDRRVIYDGLNATVPRGKITAIVGPSGTGKTTLLRLIGGQLKPESGDVRVDGVSVQSLKRAELFRLIVLMKLEAVGLRVAVDLVPSELSGGMQRRVALARAIALDPEMIMYDEPFAGQDPIGLGVLLSLVKQLNQALGLTSLVVSHDLQETLSIADHVIMIANNRVAFEGSPAVMQSSNDPLVQQFLHGSPDGPVRFHFPAPALEDALS